MRINRILFPGKRLLLGAVLGLAWGCSPKTYNPAHRFTPAQLQADYQVLREGLEAGHPSLYWYTPKPQLDASFDRLRAALDTPATELGVRRLIDRTLEDIHCGHTNTRGSVAMEAYRQRHKPADFPLQPFEADGRVYVLQNFSADSSVKKGQQLLAIEGRPVREVYAKLRKIMASDGYNETFRNTQLLNFFPSLYRYWFGEKKQYAVTLADSAGQPYDLLLSLRPEKNKNASQPVVKPQVGSPRPLVSPQVRSSLGNQALRLSFPTRDSSLAVFDHNTFSAPHYRRWYRRFFRKIQQENVRHLVLDLRNNAGGKVPAANVLMRYVMDRPFRTFREVAALPPRPAFNRYVPGRFFRWLYFQVTTHKDPKTGLRVYGSAEKLHRPMSRYGYRGNVYVLTNGGTFSAASITAANLQYWKRAVVVGRESGGGRSGCTAWVLPYLHLPHTGLRVRVPLFRLLTAVPYPNSGHGVMPDVPVVFSREDILNNLDPDMEIVYQISRPHRSSIR